MRVFQGHGGACRAQLGRHNPATDKDETHVGGEPVGYIIQLENGFKIYHMGDTGLFGDMKLIADHYKPDLIMIRSADTL